MPTTTKSLVCFLFFLVLFALCDSEHDEKSNAVEDYDIYYDSDSSSSSSVSGLYYNDMSHFSRSPVLTNKAETKSVQNAHRSGCECNHMISLSVVYHGAAALSHLKVTDTETNHHRCKFEDISPGDEITCGAGGSGVLSGLTTFKLLKEDGSHYCTGYIDTSCNGATILDSIPVGCDDLVVSQYVADDQTICGATAKYTKEEGTYGVNSGQSPHDIEVQGVATYDDMYYGSISDSYSGSMSDSYSGSISDSYSGSISDSYSDSMSNSYSNSLSDSYSDSISSGYDDMYSHHMMSDVDAAEGKEEHGITGIMVDKDNYVKISDYEHDVVLEDKDGETNNDLGDANENVQDIETVQHGAVGIEDDRVKYLSLKNKKQIKHHVSDDTLNILYLVAAVLVVNGFVLCLYCVYRKWRPKTHHMYEEEAVSDSVEIIQLTD